MSSAAASILIDEVYGRQLVESYTRTPLGTTGTVIYHEQDKPIWITYSRPSVEVLRQQAAIPVFSSEPC